jgi:hypothetical protein
LAALIALQVLLNFRIAYSPPSNRHQGTLKSIAEGDNDTTLALQKAEYEKAKAQRERFDRVTLMIMENAIDPAIRGALPKNMEIPRRSWPKLRNIFMGPLNLMPASS